MLEDPSMTHLQCSGWQTKVLVQGFMVHGPDHWVKLSSTLSRKAAQPCFHLSAWMWMVFLELMPLSLILVSSDQRTFSESFSEQGDRQSIVPSCVLGDWGLGPLTSSSCVDMGWCLTPWDDTLHGAPDQGQQMVFLILLNNGTSSCLLLTKHCTGFGLWRPLTALLSCSWSWRGWSGTNTSWFEIRRVHSWLVGLMCAPHGQKSKLWAGLLEIKYLFHSKSYFLDFYLIFCISSLKWNNYKN